MSVLRPWRAAAGSLCSEPASVFWLETTNSYLLPSDRKSKPFFSTLLSTPINKHSIWKGELNNLGGFRERRARS